MFEENLTRAGLTRSSRKGDHHSNVVGEQTAVRPFSFDVPEDPRSRSSPDHETGSERNTSVRVRVRIDGQPPGAAHGTEVDGTLSEQRLYQLIRQPGPIGDRHFEIEFLDSGAEAYCFTFG